MQLLRGVCPLWMQPPATIEQFARIIGQHLVARGWAQAGDPCVVVAGMPLGRQGATNTLSLHWIGT
jgi:pyruvate kinase